MRITPYVLAACCGVIYSLACSAAPLEDCESYYETVGAPEYQDLNGLDADEVTLLCRDGYVLAHNNTRKVSDWVLERLTVARLGGPATRKDNFKADTELASAARSTPDDYAGSGKDQGHMAPAEDMSFDQDAMNESFLLSNMAPQVGIGFNRHIWAQLEKRVRLWTERRGTLIVMTGPIYDKKRKPIGAGVAVPNQFFKVVYEPKRNRGIAFVMPNKNLTGRKIDEFIRAIDDVEALTGLDFLPDVPKARQNRLERNLPTLWEH